MLHERMRFTRLSFDILDNYMAMVRAAATDVDYAAAVAAGERGLAAREALTARNPTYTTYKKIGENGYSWWPGEVQQYLELLPLTDGSVGKLVAKTPLVWSFKRDPDNRGAEEGWAAALPAPTENVRTDLYLQAQGVMDGGLQGYNGWGWYSTQVELTGADLAAPGRTLHLGFPGLFNVAMLYVNGQAVATRQLNSARWWDNDYRFEWGVDVSPYLKQGMNRFTLRIHNPHHLGGIFRRPFLYSRPAS